MIKCKIALSFIACFDLIDRLLFHVTISKCLVISQLLESTDIQAVNRYRRHFIGIERWNTTKKVRKITTFSSESPKTIILLEIMLRLISI